MAKTRVIAGIDIGSSKIATLIAQHNQEEDKLSVVGVSSVPSKGIRKGQIVDIEEASSSVVEAVEAAERMAGYSLDHAYFTIGGAHIESKNSNGVVAVADPSGEINASDVARVIDAARAVSMPEAREILHVLPREYKVDNETFVKDPTGMSGVRLEVETHLVTGSTAAIKNIYKCASEVGVAVEGLVFSGLASSYSVLSETEKELGVVLVDIGGGTTSITAFIEGAIAFSSVFPIGGRNVTNDIAAGLRVSLDTAEKIKIALSNPKKDEGDDIPVVSQEIQDMERKVSKKTLIEGIIKPRLNEIFAMVSMELTNRGVAGRVPSGVVITGGGSLCVSTQEVARRVLSLPARIGAPKGVTGLIDEIDTPSYAGAVGLILYGSHEDRGSESSSWSSGGFMSKFPHLNTPNLPVRGLIDRAGDIFKKLLP
jgi:cell division protein FtsA